MDTTPLLDILAAPLLDEKPWATYAACKGEHGMIFFPQNKREEAAAVAICASCPVREECLDHAIATNERFGVWGGLTEKERKRVGRVA